MEYKVGDKVIVSEGIEYYVVEIKNKYNLFNVGIVFDGIRINDNEIITFKMSDIVAKSTTLKEMVMKYDEVIEKEEVEGKKYLKTWEAIKALEEGYNVKHKDWIHNQYIYKNKEGQIISNRVGPVEIDNLDNEWEIYEEPKKEIPKEFEGLMYILASINNLDCNQSDCDSCPMGIDNCNKLDEVFFSMKDKYNF